MMGKAVLAKGFSKLKFNIGLLQRLLKLMPIAFGLWYGINEFAYAVVIVSTLVFFVYAAILHYKLKLNFMKQVKNLIVPNTIFLIFILIYLVYPNHINQWVITTLFLLFHLVFIKIIKHESFIFLTNTVQKLVTILKKK